MYLIPDRWTNKFAIDSTSSSGSSQILTWEIQSAIDRMKNERHRKSTRCSYRSIWKNFNSFFVRLDDKPDTWEDRIALYVGYLVSCNKQSSMVRSYVSSIKAILENSNIELNEDRCLLSSLARACKLENDRVRQHLPIQKSLLMVLLDHVTLMYADQPYLSVLYQTLFSTAYFGLFRVGELTTSEHTVQVDDVHIAVNKQKIMFMLRSSKMHSRSMLPQKIKISSSRHKPEPTGLVPYLNYCPYSLIRRYLEI